MGWSLIEQTQRRLSSRPRVGTLRASLAALAISILLASVAPDGVASSVHVSFQTLYTRSSGADLVSGQAAVFEGPTYNSVPIGPPPSCSDPLQCPDTRQRVNYSVADWVSGQLGVGAFGTVQFDSQTDVNGRRFYLNVGQTGLAIPTGLTAKVYGRNGFSRLLPPIVLPLPDPSGSYPRSSTLQFYAPVRPSNNLSTLAPSVLRQFVLHDLQSAVDDLNARTEELKNENDEIVRHALDAVGLGAAVHLVSESYVAWRELVNDIDSLARDPLEPPEAADVAQMTSGEYRLLAAKTLGYVFALKDIVELMLLKVLQHRLVVNVEDAIHRLEATVDVGNQLAAKTFYPERVEVNGSSDDAGAIIIGGPGQHYQNDFVFGDADTTTGVSQFFSQDGSVLDAGSITTQNIHAPDNGPLLYGDSSILLSTGVRLSRHGVPLTPFADQPDGSKMAQTQFTFGSTSETGTNGFVGGLTNGLNDFALQGNVALTTDEDGRAAVKITESSPSSLTTVATVPSQPSMLVLDYCWLGNFDSMEDASFTVEFTSGEIATQLLLSKAGDPDAPRGSTVRKMVSIPPSLQGERGALRFLLSPSSQDGIASSILLTGFDIVDAPSVDSTVLPMTVVTSVSPNARVNGWNDSDVAVDLAASDNLYGSGVARIHYSLSGAQSDSQAVEGHRASIAVTGIGDTTVTYFAEDAAGRTETPKSLTVRIAHPGDVNGDGQVNALDLRAILRAFLGLESVTPLGLAAGDTRPKPGTNGLSYGDGKIRSDDVNWLLRRFVGMETVP